MGRLIRAFTFLLLAAASVATVHAQVVFSESFESNDVGVFPAGWTLDNTGDVIHVVSSPVHSGVRALRMKGAQNLSAQISRSVSHSGDFVLDFYVLLPDTGSPNEYLGMVAYQNVGAKFALGSSLSTAVIYSDNVADGISVPTNIWHHVTIEVDADNFVKRMTVEGYDPISFPTNAYSWYDLEIQTGSTNTTFASRLFYVDSVSISTATLNYPPGSPGLSSPSNNSTGLNSPIYTYWNSVSGASGYHVQIATDSTFATGVLVNDTTLTSTNRTNGIPPLLVNTTHYWRVRAKNANGWGPWSMVWRFKTVEPPAAPSLSSPANNAVLYDLDEIYHSWGFTSGASGYHLIVATDSAFTNIVLNDSLLTSTSRTVPFPPLAYNTTYYWKVRAVGAAGWGPFSSFRTYRTLPPPDVSLSTPSNNATLTSSPAAFSWYVNWPNSADSFRVQIASDTGFTNIVIDTVLTIDDMDVALSRFAPGATYYWRARGHNGGGWGPYAARRAFTVTNVPVAPTLSSPSNGATTGGFTIFLDWFLSAGSATSYEVQIASDDAFTNVVQTLTPTSSNGNATVPPLASGTKYYWRVRAQNIMGWSAYSSVWNFTTLSTPAIPIITAPAPGSRDLTGNIWFNWTATPGKDSTHIQVTTSDPNAPARVLSAAGTTNILDFYVLYYDDWYFNATQQFGHNAFFWVRMREHNDAGWGEFCPWADYSTQRPPEPPTLLYPFNGAQGVPFINTPFVAGANSIDNVISNVSVFEGTSTSGPLVGTFDLQQPYYHPNFLTGDLPILVANQSYTAVISAANDAGTINGTPITFMTADPFPLITCVMDVDDDQGGQLELDFNGSALDGNGLNGLFVNPPSGPPIPIGDLFGGSSGGPPPFGLVTDYTIVRVHDRSTSWGQQQLGRITKKVEALEPRLQSAFAVLDSAHLYDPLKSFGALGEPFYRTIVETMRDSGANRSYWERYLVIAHHSSGQQFRSKVDSGYSVDNLAPAPPGGGAAAPDGGSMRVTWTANTEADLADYKVYRSNQPGQDVRLMTPVASVVEPRYVDANPLPDAVSYYYIVARDKNDNLSEPALIVANKVTGVEALGGVPTEYSLSQNYPNPFNPSTTIRFGVPFRSRVVVQIANTLGQVVETLTQDEFNAGFYGIQWEARVPSGTYLYRIVATSLDDQSQTFTAIKKMVLIK